MQDVLRDAVEAKYAYSRMEEAGQKAALLAMAEALEARLDEILEANAEDLAKAKGKIPDVMLDRLMLNEARVAGMAKGIRSVVALESPVGLVEKEFRAENGLLIRKLRVPMGVVAIIYESRPNVTSDAAALCLRSGNVCILRGGSEAIGTNRCIAGILRGALEAAGAPANAVQLLEDTSHESARALMEARGFVDLLIPRGGKGLIKAVVEGARGVPVIETGSGICHVYVDKGADLAMAASILRNAKVQRPSVCNAAEVCLLHREVAAAFLPMLAESLPEVELRLDKAAGAILPGKAAAGGDFDTEYNDYILAVGVVDSLADAIRHINTHSTGHSEAIVTQDEAAAAEFTRLVDSAAVYVNASTRFTDGEEFGLGCEIGISTQKLGARGPMGLYEMTSYKYTIRGEGQIRG